MGGGYKRVGNLEIADDLRQVVESEIAPGTGISSTGFWGSMERVLSEFSGENESLLRDRDAIQAKIDSYYLLNEGKVDQAAYTAMLGEIGYLVREGPDFKVTTQNVDPEIACTPGPQLVCPIDNARFVLNAANARWGSLLDAFYGTDAGPPEANGAEKGKTYNPVRGAKVFDYAHAQLDEHWPLAGGAKYNDVAHFRLSNNKKLEAELKSNKVVGLADPSQFVGYTSKGSELTQILLRHNNLHVILEIDPTDTVGSTHAAGVKDILLEAAITAIADCEDSVAAVDAEDKARVYRNWAGLMRGDLNERLDKGGKITTRELNKDKSFVNASTGGDLTLPGRVVLLVRHVGLHLYTDAIRWADTKRPVPESLVDAMVTTLAAMHDLKKTSGQRNSRTGSMYVVRPKLHGPKEVDYVVRVFGKVEKELGLPENTMKMGIMDEERRTTVNLKECIRVAKERCIFINTGFLDRTGDEIHTCMRAGPVLPKAAIKQATWRLAYEDFNVDIGLETGLVGIGQIGKGMWAAPDMMKEMLVKKVGEMKQGATTAWVPSPTAATLHALHYHQVDVLKVQADYLSGGRRAVVGDILQPPMLGDKKLSQAAIQQELDNNMQGLLGYVIRWILLGIGCSKVPDINGVELMEDRATLRISSQHICNWLYHGIITKEQVMESAKRMAVIVDKQNAKQAGYEPMSPDFNGNGFLCGMEMIFNGIQCPNGLTEITLTKYRRAEKERKRTSKL